MKKVFKFSILVLLAALFVSMGCFAALTDFYPDEDGLYTVTYEGEPLNEYIIIALRGTYDVSNYVEAYNAAADEDILYYEQLSALGDGKVTFGPFAPMAYYDATIIIGGTNLLQPALVGYLRSGDISVVEGVQIKNVDDSYTVEGIAGEDVVIEVEAVLLDGFGYPAITDEKASITIEGASDDVKVDTQGVITIDKCAKASSFTVKASYGEYSDSKTVTILRQQPKPSSIVAYLDTTTKEPVTECRAVLVEGEERVELLIYASTRDQYGQEITNDTRTSYIDGKETVFDTVFEFTNTGDYIVKIESNSDKAVYITIQVEVLSRFDYEENSLLLYNLLEECEDELALLNVTKFISVDGSDVPPQYAWTTAQSKSSFEAEIQNARQTLSAYESGVYSDDMLQSYVNSLTSALNVYRGSFLPGNRVVITSIEISEKNLRLPVSTDRIPLNVTVVPAVNTDTITWSSTDSEKIYVDETGNLHAKKQGSAVITATTSTGLTASVNVTAFETASGIELSQSNLSLEYGEEPILVELRVYPAGCNEIFTWESSDPEIATVDANGLITPQSKEGTAIITVKGETQYSEQASLIVTVTLPDWETVIAPVASVEQGEVEEGTLVELSTQTVGAKIYYTLDSSEPTVQSRPYVAPIAINSDTTIKAIAVYEGMFDSAVVTYSYTIKVEDAIVYGDVNGDTRVNIQDVILLAQYCAGWDSAKEKANIKAADVNGDTRVNIQDVILLAQFCAGWDVTLG